MAIAFRSIGTVTGADSGNVASIALPAGHTTNDLLLLVSGQFDNVASTVAGYTLVASVTSGATCIIRVFAKFDGGAEAAPTLTHAAGGTTACSILAFSGIDPGLTLGTGAGAIFRDIQSTTGSGTGTLTVTSPALSGLVSGDMRVNFNIHTGTDTSGGLAGDWTPPASFTERAATGRIGASSHVNDEMNTFLSSASAGTSASGNLFGVAGTLSWVGMQLGLSSDAAAGGAVALGDPLLFNEVSGPGVDYGPYAFIEDRGITTAPPQTFLQDVTATTVAVTASMLKQVGKLVTSTAVGVTASMVRQVNKIMSSTAVSVTASFVKQVNKFLTATTVVVTASLGTIKVKLVTMTATTVVVTASMVRQVGKLLTASSVAVSASVVKQVNKTLTATAVAVTAALTTIKVKLVAMTATAVVVTASMLRRTNTTLSATVATSASIVKSITHSLTATAVSVTGSMVAQFGVVAQFFLKAFDAVLGHPQVRDDPQDADYTSDPKGKMGSNPQQGGFD